MNIVSLYRETAKANNPISQFEQEQRAKQLFKKIVKNVNGTETILDVGCNTGYYLVALNKLFPKTKAFGIDVVKENIGKAKELNKKYETTCVFFEQDFSVFESHEKFDLIICIETLEHFKKTEETLKKIFCFLKPNGKLLSQSIIVKSREFCGLF